MRQCEVCQKGSVIRGKRRLLRGHYNPLETARRYPNLQWSKIGDSRKKVCVQCMRTTAKKGVAKKA